MSLIDRLKAGTGSKLINKLKSHETGQRNTGTIAPGRGTRPVGGVQGMAGSQEDADGTLTGELERPASGVSEARRPLSRGDR